MDDVVPQGLVERFNALSLRERLLSLPGIGVSLGAVLYVVLLNRLDDRRNALERQLTSLQGSMTTAANTVEAMNSSDATSAALAQVQALRGDLDRVNAQLASQAAGMIPP